MPNSNDRLAVVASYINPHEAHVARASLEAEGIQARLDGEHHIAMDWFMSNAVGGVKVIVHERDLQAARVVLDLRVDIPDELVGDNSKPSKDEQCPACGSEDIFMEKLNRPMTAISIFLLGFPIPFLKREMICCHCSHRWDPRKRS